MSSLVIQTSFIGDVILTTPLIRKLAESGAVDVVTTPIGATVLSGNPHIRNLLVYDKRKADRGVRGFMNLAKRVREIASATSAENGDESVSAFLAQGSVRSGALAVAAGAKTRAGFTTSSSRRLYTEKVTYMGDWHHARRLLSLADFQFAESARDSDVRPELFPSDTDRHLVDTLLAGRTRPIIALAPGSVWATKRWPHFVELAALISPEFDIALIGGADDSAVAREISAHVVNADRVIDATGRLSLLGSAELIRRARAIVTNDSSPQHLASAVGTPTLTIFGPTVPAFGFGPLAPNSLSAGHKGLACRPCDKHGPQQCPLKHWRCMRELSAASVFSMLCDMTQTSAIQ